jgi:hypothetical protein
MKANQWVIVVQAADDGEVLAIDGSYLNLVRTFPVFADLDKKDTMDKLRAGLEITVGDTKLTRFTMQSPAKKATLDRLANPEPEKKPTAKKATN